MAQDLSATGFLYNNDVSADIAAVHFTCVPDVYHLTPPLAIDYGLFVFMSRRMML